MAGISGRTSSLFPGIHSIRNRLDPKIKRDWLYTRPSVQCSVFTMPTFSPAVKFDVLQVLQGKSLQRGSRTFDAWCACAPWCPFLTIDGRAPALPVDGQAGHDFFQAPAILTLLSPPPAAAAGGRAPRR